MLLGIPGDNTYSNYQEANRVFFRGTVLPLGHGRILREGSRVALLSLGPRLADALPRPGAQGRARSLVERVYVFAGAEQATFAARAVGYGIAGLRVDARRVLVLRTASNYTWPGAGKPM